MLARTACGVLLDMPPRRVPVEITALGRPDLRRRPGEPPLSMSIAHAGGVVAVALTADGRAGADIEPVVPPPAGAVRWSCSPAEADALSGLGTAAATTAFLRLWTAKEACLKASGTGIRRRLSGLDLGLGSSGCWHRISWQALQPAAGLVAAVAVAGGPGSPPPPQVRVMNLLEQEGLP